MAEQESFIIQGILTDKGGKTAAGLVVQAYIDTTQIEPQLLGETTSDQNGKYQIEYTKDKIKELDLSGNVYIIIKVVTKEGEILKTDSRKRSESGSQEINLKDIDYFQLNPEQRSRLDTLKAVFSDMEIRTKLDGAFTTAKGDWSATMAALKKSKVKEDILKKLDFAYALADLTEDDAHLVREIATEKYPRLEIIKTVVSDKTIEPNLNLAFTNALGDWPVTRDFLEESGITKEKMKKLDFAHDLSELTKDNAPLAKKIFNKNDLNSSRDLALKYNDKSRAKLISTSDVPDSIEGTPEERVNTYANILNNRLYLSETSATLQRMVSADELPIADVSVQKGVKSFLAKQPDFNIRQTSVYTAFSNPDAFKGIAEEHREGVAQQLKVLQTVQAISPTAEVIPELIKANLTSAYQVSELPESTFIKAFDKRIGEQAARQVYNNAVNNRVRNEHALMSLREVYRGTGVAFIDQHQYRHQSPVDSAAETQDDTNEQGVPLNLEELFGSVDLCECDECNSVYSPSAYFVELLQYLRNNNLNLDPNKVKYPNTGEEGIADTALEMLFRRRPDLACLELTCKNAFTVLPYIDLVNEVMESFVVHLGEYHADNHVPKQAALETFNVEDEISSELMAQPQHINYKAYCILKHAVYPFTLPYHQPIDAIRIFLKYLETSRYELMKTFRSVSDIGINNEEDESPADDNPAELVESTELAALIDTAIDRAIDAEFLGITQAEYIILTKEAFCQKEYFDIKLDKTHTEEEYQQMIGVKSVHVYYGYGNEADMLSTAETQQTGLTFVKKQFLKRTGIKYTDLVDLLKTQCINPNQPQGKALTIMESIQFSYRFLQTLVVKDSSDRDKRFKKLIVFLEKNQPWLPLLEALLNPDPCDQQKPDWRLETECFHKWVYCYFERIGKLIVLESGDNPVLPIEGALHWPDNQGHIGQLRRDGVITNVAGNEIGKVNIAGQVVDTNGNPFSESFNNETLDIKNNQGEIIGRIADGRREWPGGETIIWLYPDTCDLDKVRLKHLDGTDLTVEEYDRIHRFIRLWRKLGWTIDEVDKALIGLATQTSDTETLLLGNDDICFDEFEDVRECEERCDEFDCPSFDSPAPCRITPDFLHQLVAVKKLLEKTGLSVLKLLTFWTKISTVGEKSLYKSLFLKHNLLGIDEVFKADNNGYYLTGDDKISEHIPVLMAAFNLKAEDIETIMDSMEIDDKLTLANVSILYHMRLLAKVLHVRIPELMEVISLFGDPFKNANDTLALIKKWEKMEDAGFKFRELNYIIRDRDDAKRPLIPTRKSLLQLALILYDGLNEIDELHPDLADGEDAAVDVIRAKASLLFEQPVVEEIINLLEGTTVYTTNAPAELDIDLSGFTDSRITYDAKNGVFQVTGILTNEEETAYKNLSNHPEWQKAFERIRQQALIFFNDTLYAIFPDNDKAKEELLKPDVNIPQDQQDPNNPIPSTAIEKRNFFLESFLPFLRERLTRRFLLDTLSSSVGLSQEVTDTLISEVLIAGEDKKPIINLFSAIKKVQAQGEEGWQGYLIPTADGEYTFVVENETQPDPLRIDGRAIELHQQDDPSNVWLSEPVKLVGRQSYTFQVSGLDPELKNLSWKTSTSPKTPIPASVLFPDYSVDGLEAAFKQLQKAALLVNGFEMSQDEVEHFNKYATDFDDLDFNEFTLNHWLRLQAYTQFRDSLPETDTNLIELFRWALNPDDAAKLTEKIATLTEWEKERIDKLVAPEHFDLNRPDAFLNEKHFVKLQRALKVADKIGTDINLLFEWAKPKSKFWETHKIAESIRKTIRAHYLQEDWEQVIKPLNDKLRENQKQALISYLLVQQDLIDWGVIDANSLFEFFLIDVQMESCMETSRIKQAISSVQLFVQRCFLGLEEPYGIRSDKLDRNRWEWMQRYRVWEANRKVFLYPENWIEPNLRDDKSPFFLELESELLQKDINQQTVKDALKSYLYNPSLPLILVTHCYYYSIKFFIDVILI